MGSNRLEVFFVALKLGLTSFGGPFAHLGYFHDEYVRRRKWVDDEAYADLVALCQLLPGPTSSQIGMAVGRLRAGTAGAFLAWVGFTLPSALLMVAFAFLWRTLPRDGTGLVRGLELAAFAVVFQALWGMAGKLVDGKRKLVVALAAAAALGLLPSPWTQPLTLVAAGLTGLVLFRDVKASEPVPRPRAPQTLVWLLLFTGFLVLLPGIAALWGAPLVTLADSFYRTGSLVFGGGHVVLPLLQTELVSTGRMGLEDFLAGYAFAQTVPGPLFSVAAFYGTVTAGPGGGLVALVAIFLPSFLLLAGVAPWWGWLRQNLVVRRGLLAVNAGVVGFLAWTLYNPIGVQALRHPGDFVVATGLVLWLLLAKGPSWAVVVVGAGAGLGLQALGF